MAGIARLTIVVLDCAEPRPLARFYAGLIGADRIDGDDDWVTVTDASGLRLAFQRVPDYRPPRWPDPAHPTQAHLDLEIDAADLADAEAAVLAAGATRAPVQPLSWLRVYADPAGHPFCLYWSAG